MPWHTEPPTTSGWYILKFKHALTGYIDIIEAWFDATWYRGGWERIPLGWCTEEEYMEEFNDA